MSDNFKKTLIAGAVIVAALALSFISYKNESDWTTTS